MCFPQASLQRAQVSATPAAPRAPRVVIQRPAKVQRVRQALVDGGPGKLSVISDFDYTLSKHEVDGELGASCFKVLASCKGLSQKFKEQDEAKRRHFLKIEADTAIPDAEKQPLLIDWLEWSLEQFVAEQLQRSDLSTSLRQSSMQLRDGHERVMQLLSQEGIPFLIFSAGVADVIEDTLRWQAPSVASSIGESIHIIANRMRFEADGEPHAALCGFEQPIIHNFNKDASLLEHSKPNLFSALSSRPHAILLGDNLSDLGMSRGLQLDAAITVGFLNNPSDDRLAEYTDKFDVVVIGSDAGLSYVHELLEEVCRAE